MNFLQNPLAWSLAALLPVIVVFYLLKLKRRRVLIPSTLLWRRSVQDLIANSPFQRLRNNLLMWLQLLLLALLIFAFMRPVTMLDHLGGTTLVLLIDNSASMQTQEAGGQSRLEMARSQARDAIESLGARDEAILITFSDRTNIVQTLTSDKSSLRSALAAIQPVDTEANLSEATLILQGLTTIERPDGGRLPRENTRTIVLSDGIVRGAEALVDVPNVTYVRVGETDDNLGITNVDVRESYADDFSYQIFASIANASEEDRDVFVELVSEGELIDIREVTVPGLGTSGVVFTAPAGIDGLAVVRLDIEDALALDNIAYAHIRPPSEINVLLVTDGNPFLEQVFLVDPRVRVSVMRPVDYPPREEYDITVFDSTTTSQILPGNYVFLNAVPPLPGYSAGDEPIANPRVIDWNRVHPLTRYTNFEEILIGEAIDLSKPEETATVVEALATDLIAFHEDDVYRVLIVGFDIFNSTWPLDVSFPIFWANAIDHFARTGTGGYLPAYRAGSTIPIVPGREATSATVVTPAGDTVEFEFDEGIATGYLTQTQRAGTYDLSFDDGAQFRLAVNLASEQETLIRPRDELDTGSHTIEATASTVRTNQEIWHWFALLALGVLMLEWFVYCRRTYA